MSENISVCGTDCGACSFVWGTVPGLQRMSGARVSCADGLRVLDLRLCAGEKGLRNCAQCPDLPCSLWQSTRDPSFTDEQFAANIAGRVENLRKRMTNLSSLPSWRRCRKSAESP